MWHVIAYRYVYIYTIYLWMTVAIPIDESNGPMARTTTSSIIYIQHTYSINWFAHWPKKKQKTKWSLIQTIVIIVVVIVPLGYTVQSLRFASIHCRWLNMIENYSNENRLNIILIILSRAFGSISINSASAYHYWSAHRHYYSQLSALSCYLGRRAKWLQRHCRTSL